jgi:beta-galactosidase
MGRVNYGPKLFDRKGVVGGIRLGQRYHFGWEIRCLTMDDLSRLNWQSLVHTKQPQFLRGTFRVDTPTDTFLKLEGFAKGFCVLNGFNLGRYFNPAGPQKTLFVPGPLLKSGDNELIVFESDAYQVPTVEFLDTPELG